MNRQQREWFSDDVMANGVRLHYYRTGGDKPPVVLCHGISDDGLCWTPVARALEREYDVIMPDARGHGLSDAPRPGDNLDTLVADLAALLDALELERPALGGHSLGAVTVLYAAAMQPARFRCLLLEDPPLSALDMQAEETVAHTNEILSWVHGLQGLTPAQLIDLAQRDNPSWSDAELRPWADSKLRARPGARFLLTEPRRDWREQLASITCRALLITADPERGAAVTPEDSDEAARILPALEIVRLRGAGHNIRREQYDAYLAAVRAGLAS